MLTVCQNIANNETLYYKVGNYELPRSMETLDTTDTLKYKPMMKYQL
jgi:hypothetical protein